MYACCLNKNDFILYQILFTDSNAPWLSALTAILDRRAHLIGFLVRDVSITLYKKVNN